MITGVSRVVLPVSDHDVAKAFWTDQVGFEWLQDTTMGDERWVEVRPRAGGPVISLVTGEPAQPADPATPSLQTSNVFFECDDLLATHEELSERGVTFSSRPSSSSSAGGRSSKTPTVNATHCVSVATNRCTAESSCSVWWP